MKNSMKKVGQCLQWRDISLCLPSNRKENYVDVFQDKIWFIVFHPRFV